MPSSVATLVDYLRRKNRERLARRRQRKCEQWRGELAVLAIMKNEAMNIDEWMSHYFQVGANRIVLIDNGSTDDTVMKAQAWVAKGNVDLILRPERHKQLDHYWEGISSFVLGKYTWLLVVDLDEFWFCPDGNTIPEKLSDRQYNDVDVIYANWRMFGSSGLINHPTSIRMSLTHSDPKLGPHRFTKYLCRASVLKSRKNITGHHIVGVDSSRACTDNESFHLFHYTIQSLNYFQSVKMTRGDAYEQRSDSVRNMDYFMRYDAPCTVQNRTLADLVEQGRLGKG